MIVFSCFNCVHNNKVDFKCDVNRFSHPRAVNCSSHKEITKSVVALPPPKKGKKQPVEFFTWSDEKKTHLSAYALLP